MDHPQNMEVGKSFSLSSELIDKFISKISSRISEILDDRLEEALAANVPDQEELKILMQHVHKIWIEIISEIFQQEVLDAILKKVAAANVPYQKEFKITVKDVRTMLTEIVPKLIFYDPYYFIAMGLIATDPDVKNKAEEVSKFICRNFEDTQK